MARTGVVAIFDVGATHTRIALAREARSFEQLERFDTVPTAKGLVLLATKLDDLARGSQLVGVVGGIAGKLDYVTGSLTQSTNLGWQGLAVGSELKQRLGVPVLLENDTALVGLGEAWFGAGVGYGTFMYETVSTGVNAVRIINGCIDTTTRGAEIGHQIITDADGRPTALEAATGGAALQRKYGRSPRELASSSLWRSEARLLARGLSTSIVHWSPEAVVMGGAMMRDISVDDIGLELKRLLPEAAVPIVEAKLGDNGGLYGALALAHQHGFI